MNMVRILSGNLRSNAMVLTVGISMVISIILSSMILVSYYYNLLSVKDHVVLELERNLDSAFEIVQADLGRFQKDGTTVLDLFDQGKDSVIVHSSFWGMYQQVEIIAKRGKYERKRSALVGALPDANHSWALYLTDIQRNRLVLLGTSAITGDAMVPSGKFSSEWFGSRGYTGGGISGGQIGQSNPELPHVNEDRLIQLNSWMEGTFSSNVEKIAELPREKIRPFDQSLLVYSDDRPVLITQRLQKNILIHSTSEIEVSFSSQLEDVILVAPKIVIQEFVSGTFQAFATDSIIVKTGVKLGFPSVLGVLSDHPAKISLNSAQIQGCVFGYSRTNAEKPTIRIDDYSVVIGEVYVDGFLELYGRVSGTVACTNFLLARYGEIRENNLLDGTINRGELSKAFIFSLLHAENPKGGIVKWL